MSEVRTGYPGTEAAGDVLTAANFDKLPGGWIGYSLYEKTTGSQTIDAGDTDDVTNLSVTVTVGESRLLKVSAGVAISLEDSGGGQASVILKEGSTTVLSWDWNMGVGRDFVEFSALTTPSVGDVTYKVQITALTEPIHVNANALSTGDSYILVEDLGPAPA